LIEGHIGGGLISTESVRPRLDKLMMSKYLPAVGQVSYEIAGNCLIDRNALDWEITSTAVTDTFGCFSYHETWTL